MYLSVNSDQNRFSLLDKSVLISLDGSALYIFVIFVRNLSIKILICASVVASFNNFDFDFGTALASCFALNKARLSTGTGTGTGSGISVLIKSCMSANKDCFILTGTDVDVGSTISSNFGSILEYNFLACA